MILDDAGVSVIKETLSQVHYQFLKEQNGLVHIKISNALG